MTKPSPSPAALDEWLAFARQLANAAHDLLAPAAALRPELEVKADRSFVTALDAQIETRLRELIEILNRVLPWAGSPLAAYAWYRSQSLPSFGDITPEQLVRDGRADDVRHYLDRIAAGGFA